jgi:hypothetical protein
MGAPAQYEVVIRRESFGWFTVEANSLEDAEQQALAEAKMSSSEIDSQGVHEYDVHSVQLETPEGDESASTGS